MLKIGGDRQHLHGSLCGDRPPVAWLESGESIQLSTLDVGWGLEPPASVDAPRRKVENREDGPALCGPIGIRDAAPGMTLEVQVERLVPASWGWTYSGGDAGPLNRALGISDSPLNLVVWTLDAEGGMARSRLADLPMRPFLGVMGVAPPAGQTQSGWVPYEGGGNLDCKELTVGSSLYLPVLHEGALLSVGDGHALQGDGEVGGMAIECPMDEVRLRVVLHRELEIALPRARTREAWIGFGFGKDLEEAALLAINQLIAILMEERSVSRSDAVALLSVTSDLRISQMVNGMKGVHALLPVDVLGA